MRARVAKKVMRRWCTGWPRPSYRPSTVIEARRITWRLRCRALAGSRTIGDRYGRWDPNHPFDPTELPF